MVKKDGTKTAVREGIVRVSKFDTRRRVGSRRPNVARLEFHDAIRRVSSLITSILTNE